MQCKCVTHGPMKSGVPGAGIKGRDNVFHPTDTVGCINKMGPKQNGRHLPDKIFKCILLNENVWISIDISLNLVPKCLISNIPAFIQIMAWRRPGDNPLSETIMVSFYMHICVTRPHWVNLSLSLIPCSGTQVFVCYFFFINTFQNIELGLVIGTSHKNKMYILPGLVQSIGTAYKMHVWNQLNIIIKSLYIHWMYYS